MKQFLIWLFTAVFVVSGCFIFVKKLDFKQNCSGRLERAATANTVELAMTELNAAIEYATVHDYTHGYTSVFYRTPDEDIEFWYNNLVASYNELKNLPVDATTLEKTNTLMKLRESLTEQGESKAYVIYPDGLMFYPHNLLWGIVRFLFVISLALTFLVIAEYDKWSYL